jgi:hypothetical protein
MSADPGPLVNGDTISPLEELKAKFAETKKPPRLYKSLPGGDGKCVAEYGVVGKDEAQESPEPTDLLIRALVAIHRHAPDHPKADKRGLVEFSEWAGQDFGGPLRFDNRLADALSIKQGSAREVCLQMFNDGTPGGNEIALETQASVLLAWMTDTSAENLQDFTEGSSTTQ